MFQHNENNLVRCICRLHGGAANVMCASTQTTKRIILLQYSKLATTTIDMHVSVNQLQCAC